MKSYNLAKSFINVSKVTEQPRHSKNWTWNISISPTDGWSESAEQINLYVTFFFFVKNVFTFCFLQRTEQLYELVNQN